MIQAAPERKRWLLLGLLLLSILAFGLIVGSVLGEHSLHWDQQCMAWMRAPEQNAWRPWMTAISLSGSAFGLSALALGLIYWLAKVRRDPHALRLFLWANGGGAVLNPLLKLCFQRERPSAEGGFDAIGSSLPSGHAMAAVIFYGLVSWWLWHSSLPRPYKTLLGVVFAAYALLIGFSRGFVGAHYLTDVAAGWCAGLAWLCLCLLCYNGRGLGAKPSTEV